MRNAGSAIDALKAGYQVARVVLKSLMASRTLWSLEPATAMRCTGEA